MKKETVSNKVSTLVFEALQLGENKTSILDGQSIEVKETLPLNDVNPKTLGAFIGKCIAHSEKIALLVNPTLSFYLLEGTNKTALVGNYKLHMLKAMRGGGEASLKFGIFKANLLGLIANNTKDVELLQSLTTANMISGEKHTSKDVTTLQIVANDYVKGVKAIAGDIRKSAKVGTISNAILECKRISNTIARLQSKATDKATNDKIKALQSTLATLQNSIKDKNLLTY